MPWIADPPTLSELGEETMWDLYRRRQWAGTADADYEAWCARQGLDPADVRSARAYEDWFVDHGDMEGMETYWRERGFGS